MIKILSFSSSNNADSVNRYLLSHCGDIILKEILPNAQITNINMSDYAMPLYSAEIENSSGIPECAQQFFEKIKQCDVIIMSHAEHNGSVTAVFKNLFDWTSRIQEAQMAVFQNKPIILLSASPGPRSGAGVLSYLQNVLPHFKGDIKACLGIGNFHKVFDFENNSISDKDISEKLREALNTLTNI